TPEKAECGTSPHETLERSTGASLSPMSIFEPTEIGLNYAAVLAIPRNSSAWSPAHWRNVRGRVPVISANIVETNAGSPTAAPQALNSFSMTAETDVAVAMPQSITVT